MCVFHMGGLQKWHFLLLVLFCLLCVQQHLMKVEFEVTYYILGVLLRLKPEAYVSASSTKRVNFKIFGLHIQETLSKSFFLI